MSAKSSLASTVKCILLSSKLQLVSHCCNRCRVSETESLINSHLYTPRCVSVQSPEPYDCQCGDDNVPACVNENTVFDPSLPTVTFLTNSTATCSSTAPKRYVHRRDRTSLCDMSCR